MSGEIRMGGGKSVMPLAQLMADQIQNANERELLAREVRLLHAVAEAATQLRLAESALIPLEVGRSPQWRGLLLALDAAGYGPDGVGHSVKA